MDRDRYIGLLGPRHFRYYTHEVVDRMVAYASAHPYLHFCDMRFSSMDDAADQLQKTECDAYIVGLNRPEFDLLSAYFSPDKPIINVHPDLLRLDIPTVCIDHESLAATVIDYLSGLGVPNLAALGTHGSNGFDDFAATLAAQGADKGMQASAFRIKLDSYDYEKTHTMPDLPEVDRWVTELQKPVGIVTTGGYTAMMLCRTVKRLGFRIPEDVGIMSRSDDQICLFTAPPVTSVQSAGDELGEIALSIIHNTLLGKPHPTGRITVEAPTILERSSTGFPAGMDDGIKRAIRFIRQHACEGITVEDVVRHARIISRTTLYTQLNHYIGRSPAAEILRLKLERARYELDLTTHSMALIAEHCGFTSNSQFATTFRRETGLTPSAYRKRHRL